MVKEEIVEFIWSDDVLCDLAYLTVFSRKKLRGDRRRENIKKNF